MVKIIIENLGQKEVQVTEPNKPVLRQFQAHFIDYLHECGGKGRCTTCKMKIITGMENLTPLTWAEKKYRDEHLLRDDERLACQVIAKGNLVVSIPRETQLPHVKYDY
jgi:2Fe-2S ferredoxin